MGNKKMRAEFESWAVAEGLMLHGKDGRYLKEIQSAWMAWQASRAELVIELPFEFVNRMMRADQVISSIEAAGVRVTP